MRPPSALALAALAVAALAIGPGRTWAAASAGYHVLSRIPLADGGWDLASFDPALRRVYLARTDGVLAVDADSGVVIARLAPANRSHAVVPLRGGTELLVTDGGTNAARFLDARSGRELGSVKVGERPDAALFDPASGLAAVMNAGSGDISLIDPAARAVVATIAVGGALELGATDGTGRMFVNVEDRSEVVLVDLKTRTLVSRAKLAGCEEPTGIAWLPLARRLLSSCANGVAAVINPATLAVERTLPIGAGPDTVAFDARRHRAFIPAGRAGELYLFADEAGGVRPLGSVVTQRGARTGTVDERTGRLYLPAADYLPPAGAGGRPQAKPGSVVMLVVGP